MQVLTEYFSLPYDRKMVKEQKEKNKNITLSGILQQADTVNGNGRAYPYGVLKREVEKYKDFVNNRRSVGCADHEDSPIISLERVSHLVTEVEFEESTGIVKGKIEILPTPCGKIIEALVESGVNIGISSRGVGSLIKEGDHDKVGDDYHLICWDIVSEGSVPGSWLMKEAREFSDIRIKHPSRREVESLLSPEERLSIVLDRILTN